MKPDWEGRIPDEHLFYLQRLEYEIGGARIIVERLLREGRPDNALFDRYALEYRKLLSERGTLMREIVEEFAPEDYRTPDYAMRVNHHSGMLQVMRVNQDRCASTCPSRKGAANHAG